MDRFEWQLDIYPYDSGDDYTQELAELSGVELYQVALDIDWETGRRERTTHFSTMRSVLANR